MTRASPFDTSTISTDVRMIAAGVASNVLIARPYLITATGRAAPSQHTVVPSGVSASFALMPHVDYHDDPGKRPGAGFVGGRLSSITPFLAPGQIPVHEALAVPLKMLPVSREQILRDLRTSAGLHWAPGALFGLAGWEDEWVAAWLDRLRENGDEGRLIVAHAQAALAMRKMWLAVVWNVNPSRAAGSHLATTAGAAVVGRALIDVVAMVVRIRQAAGDQGATSAYTDAAISKLLACLHHYLRHVRAADASSNPGLARGKLKRALIWARRLIDAIALFSVAGESLRQGWYRLDRALSKVNPFDHAGPIEPRLDAFSRDLERLHCASAGTRLHATSWRNHIRRALLRLADPDRQLRLQHLYRVRCDLIYALAIGRRLDRLYEVFPWLASPHGAFLGCAGGALGALASLFECDRAMQIGHDLKRRLQDDDFGRATVSRLTVCKARALFTSPRSVCVSAGRGHAAGAELIQQSISHANVQAGLAGALFGPHACLTHAQAGRLGWNEAAALRDPAAAKAATDRAAATSLFSTLSRDDDAPRFMGLSILRLINAAIFSIFPTKSQRGDFTQHRAQARDAAKHADRPKSTGQSGQDSVTALQDTMLRSLDVDPATDPRLRDAIADTVALGGSDEVARAERLQTNATPKCRAYDEHQDGQGRRRTAGDERINADERGALLRDLIDDVRRWRSPIKGDGKRAPRDDLLEDVLRGRKRLPGLFPVSDLFLPILWFAPFIDRELLGWMACGAALNGITDPHAEAIADEISRTRAWAAPLYATGVTRGRDDCIACHLFTGVSSVTSDFGHAW